MGLAHSPSIISDGLIFYLDAANTRSYSGSGNTTYSLAGLASTSSLVNGVGFTSSNNGSFVFDGTNDYASIPISLSSSNMTIELVFKINADSPWEDIATLDDGSNTILIEQGSVSETPNTNGYLRYYSYYANGVGSVTNSLASSSQYILDSKIHLSSLTVGSSLASSYFDGIFQGSASVVENKNFNRLVLANDLVRTGRNCSCSIYQVKLYNRALSATEILQNYNATRKRFGL